ELPPQRERLAPPRHAWHLLVVECAIVELGGLRVLGGACGNEGHRGSGEDGKGQQGEIAAATAHRCAPSREGTGSSLPSGRRRRRQPISAAIASACTCRRAPIPRRRHRGRT